MSEGNLVKPKHANKMCGSFFTRLGGSCGCGERNNPNSIGLLPGVLVRKRNGSKIIDGSGPGPGVIPFTISESAWYCR